MGSGAREPTFWIGTSGWIYRHWRGTFYPPDLPQRAWFDYYAAHFPTVELNFSFYREPKAATWDAWRQKAPEGFRFAVKAHRYLTHRIRLRDPEATLERVYKGARRLGDRLGPVLYQLPPYFKRTPENEERLETFFRLLPADVNHVVEFRDESWYADETFAQLRRHGVAYCCFDRGGEGPPVTATAPFFYMRFHGSSAKYAGNYTDAMLRDWAARLRGLGDDTREAWVYFNNDWQGFAVANALKLAELLGVRLPEPAPA